MKGADVTELYSPNRVNAMCADYGLQPGSSLDLTNGWDLSLKGHREGGQPEDERRSTEVRHWEPTVHSLFKPSGHEPNP